MFRSRFAGSAWVLALSLAAGGCGQLAGTATTYRDRNPLPPDTLTVPAAEIGRYGGRFVLAQTFAPKTFNALMANESSSSDVNLRLYAGLVDYDNATQQDRPGIAKSWDTSPDGLTWTWHLRHGARFSDGHLITSEDVLFMFAVAYDSTLHPAIQDIIKPGGKPMEVSAPDSYTVVTKTAAPFALMTAAVGALPIMPKHILEPVYRRGGFAAAYNTGTRPDSLVTSGPWRLEQFLPGEKTVLTRNPWWYGVDAAGHRLPYLDELVFLIVADQDAAVLKFQSGEVDGIDNVKPEDYQGYSDRQQKENFTLYDLGPSLATHFIWFNLNTVKQAKPGQPVGAPVVGAMKYSWFNQRDFRRAVSKAIDRDAIIRSVMFGEGIKNWSTSTAGNKKWFLPEAKGEDYDLEGAKKLLAGLGWKDRNGDGVLEDRKGQPIRFSMKTNADNKVRVQMANFVKDDLAKIGIDCILAPVEFNTMTTNMKEDFQYDAILGGLNSGVPPDPVMSKNVYRSSGPTHYWNVRQRHPETPQEAELDRLMDECSGTSDFARRQAAFASMIQIINDQAWFVWLPVVKIKVPIRNGFGNLQPTIIPHRILWNIDRVFVKPNARPA